MKHTVWQLRLAFPIVLILVSGCLFGEGSGTYDMSVSGAVAARVTGKASAGETKVLGLTHESYNIVLSLPDTLPGMEESQRGTLQFFIVPMAFAGDYRVVNMSRILEKVPHEMAVLLIGEDEVHWHSVDGSVRLERGGFPSRRRRGSFSVRFARQRSVGDTIAVAGTFDVR